MSRGFIIDYSQFFPIGFWVKTTVEIREFGIDKISFFIDQAIPPRLSIVTEVHEVCAELSV